MARGLVLALSNPLDAPVGARCMRLSQPRRKRLLWVVVWMGLAAAAVSMMLKALEQNVMYFYSVSELNQKVTETAPGTSAPLRLGGVVAQDSLRRQDAMTVRFEVTDFKQSVPVIYQGLLPNLFREGQGVVATGNWEAGVFYASELLAKHDENYMPPEVAASLKNQGP